MNSAVKRGTPPWRRTRSRRDSGLGCSPRGPRAWTVTRLFALAMVVTFVVAGDAYAGPEGHILRIDPRASQAEDSPILTTVIEVNQVKPANQVLGVCSALSGNAELDCVADAVEKPQALWSPIEFPEQNAFLTVLVDGTDYPAKYLSKQRWAEASKESGVGTAWLIAGPRRSPDGLAHRRGEAGRHDVRQRHARERHRERHDLQRSQRRRRVRLGRKRSPRRSSRCRTSRSFRCRAAPGRSARSAAPAGGDRRLPASSTTSA